MNLITMIGLNLHCILGNSYKNYRKNGSAPARIETDFFYVINGLK